MRPLLFLLVPAALHAQMITANPCNLLTPAEVLSATQDSVRTTALSQFQNPVCTIITSDSNATISVKIETTRDYEDAYWDVVGDSTKAIPSLGERAVVTGKTQPVTKILRRGRVYSITYINQTVTPDQIRAREKALAFFAIARAP
ncbi:MAG TPA: hypothetical protein VFA43_06045 [Gemmatimonadaceae bacterium]|nr:hypothetical protein [Gemmatimonadaceae bacterium]